MEKSRHERDCKTCKHPRLEAIEAEFVAWSSPGKIARQYKLGSRASLYRHAQACGLVAKRDRNIRAALSRIIEKVGNVRVTAGAIVQAVAVFAKINASGAWVDRSEHVNLNELFDRMSHAEMETYASTGALPDWFEQIVGNRTLLAANSEGETAE